MSVRSASAKHGRASRLLFGIFAISDFSLASLAISWSNEKFDPTVAQQLANEGAHDVPKLIPSIARRDQKFFCILQTNQTSHNPTGAAPLPLPLRLHQDRRAAIQAQ